MAYSLFSPRYNTKKGSKTIPVLIENPPLESEVQDRRRTYSSNAVNFIRDLLLKRSFSLGVLQMHRNNKKNL
jgi:hypothetical protein